jgi:hypothetical protein
MSPSDVHGDVARRARQHDVEARIAPKIGSAVDEEQVDILFERKAN